MKIGILTYHRAENMGAIMQAYALVTYLRQCGHDAEIIDYRCKNIEARYDIFNPRLFLQRKNFIASFREYRERFSNIADRVTKKAKFKQFRKQLPTSGSVKSADEIKGYDTIIVGSDQVWNFHLCKGDEKTYLLDFGKKGSFRKISYAASSEKNGLSRISDRELALALKDFDRISVRESFLKDRLRSLTDKGIEITLDPVFLLSAKDYLKIAVKPKAEGYILVFHMTYSSEIVSLAQKLAESKNLRVIECFGGFSGKTTESSISNWGPEELLGYIANAGTVFTTSFHGLALSLILRKDVWVIDKGDNFRQKNLMRIAGIEKRLMNSVYDYNDSPIDYDAVDKNLGVLILKSKQFLQ